MVLQRCLVSAKGIVVGRKRVLPSLRYAFLMSSTEASCSRRQLLSLGLTPCKQTYIGQFQVRIVVSFDVGLHHDPGKTVASQQSGVVRCDTIKALRRRLVLLECRWCA
jgi:hypothetical protein